MRRLSQNCRTKRENVERLKGDVTAIELRTSSVQQTIDACVNELNVSISNKNGMSHVFVVD